MKKLKNCFKKRKKFSKNSKINQDKKLIESQKYEIMIGNMNRLLIATKSKYDEMSKTEKKIADYLFLNASSIKQTTITNLAQLIGVSEATILRFAKRIGCSGYPQFRIMLANEENHHIVNESINKEDTFLQMYSKIGDDVYSSIIKTKNGLTDELLNSAYNLIIKADKILIAGVGNSYVMGLDLYHKLLRAGFNVTMALDSHFGIISSCQLSEKSLFITISHSGYTKDIYDAVMVAKAKGAKVLTITSNHKSPVANESDLVLQTSSNEINYRVLGLTSRYSQLLIFDTLYSYIVTHSQKVEETIEYIEDNIAIKRVNKKGK